MSDQRRFTRWSGRLASAPIQDFWQISRTVQDPAIPNLPLETPAGGGSTLILTATTGAVVVTGEVASVTFSKVPTTGAVSVVGQTPSVTFTREPTTGAVTLTGFAPSREVGVILTPTTGAVIVAGEIPNVTFTREPTQGAVIVTGQTPSISFERTPAAGAVIVAGQTPSITTAREPTAGAVQIVGFAPGREIGIILTPTTGEVVVTGEAPSISIERTPTPGSIDVVGFAPTLDLIIAEQPNSGGGVIISGSGWRVRRRKGLSPITYARIPPRIQAKAPRIVVALERAKRAFAQPALYVDFERDFIAALKDIRALLDSIDRSRDIRDDEEREAQAKELKRLDEEREALLDVQAALEDALVEATRRSNVLLEETESLRKDIAAFAASEKRRQDDELTAILLASYYAFAEED